MAFSHSAPLGYITDHVRGTRIFTSNYCEFYIFINVGQKMPQKPI